jgi:hypothetical protein
MGQLFVMGFDGTTVDPQIRSLIENYHLGSILLTAKNLKCTVSHDFLFPCSSPLRMLFYALRSCRILPVASVVDTSSHRTVSILCGV